MTSDSKETTKSVDLSRELGDYDRFERLDIVRKVAGFLPTSANELNAAFRRVYHKEQTAETVDTNLGKVLGRQRTTGAERPEAAVETIVAGYAAYAKQARRDASALLELGKDIFQSPEPEDSTRSLAERFGSIPAFSGPGQLARFLSIKRLAEDGSADGLPFDPLDKIKLVRSELSGKLGVLDPFTIANIRPEIGERISEALGSKDAADAQTLFPEAVDDQIAREKFWVDGLVEAKREAYASPIAELALRELRVIGFYPEHTEQ